MDSVLTLACTTVFVFVLERILLYFWDKLKRSHQRKKGNRR